MSFSGFDHECMATALQLARKGLFTTDPNPRVGCVIAGPDGIAGAGWHEKAGAAHAEIMALRDAGGAARGKTAYITLEPCSHQGRTPPCSTALVEAGVERVVIASLDPNPSVNGSGRAQLQAEGIRVETGLMSQQAEALNPGFMMRMRAGRPWVRVKSAISLDGRTGLQSGESKWISSEASRRDVQRWRARSSAILTGIGTVLADDPSMDARVAEAVSQPLKVIVDTRWRTPVTSRILAAADRVIIAGAESIPVPGELAGTGAHCLRVETDDDMIRPGALLTSLAALEINEVQVEAGATLCGSLLRARLVDELLIYQAPVLLGDGGAGPFAFGPLESMADRTHLRLLETTHFGDDLRIRFQPQYRD